MEGCKKVTTTREVYAVIHASHPTLEVFSTYSAPDGDSFGNPDKCVMMTEFGFEDCDYPIIGTKTTWDKNPEKPNMLENQKDEYWLFIAKGSE